MMRTDDMLKYEVEKIPSSTDILITHGPPLGFGDASNGIHTGSAMLLHEVVYRVMPMLHVFGHIHEAAIMVKSRNITFVNASVLRKNYSVRPQHGVVVDLPKR